MKNATEVYDEGRDGAYNKGNGYGVAQVRRFPLRSTQITTEADRVMRRGARNEIAGKGAVMRWRWGGGVRCIKI